MTPLVYQNRSGTESLWASQTVILSYPNGPTAIRWYQMNVAGGNFPATPVQQQSWTNGSDGLWRWMPSIAVDQNGNMAIGYSTSSATQEPSIRYAGRLASDPLNSLGQGEAVMTAGGGHQTHSSGRWGDYSMLTIDPADNLSFWHTNEYYPVTSSASWFTRIGKFRFPAASPTPTPTPNPTPTPTPVSQCTVPNFIGGRLNRAQSIWSNAGFTTRVTTVGPGGHNITSQSLSPGYVGSCTTTTITVTAR